MTILSDRDILKEYKKGNIKIEPYNKALLQGCSYDIRLDEFFVELEAYRKFGQEKPDPFDMTNFEGSKTLLGYFERGSRIILKPKQRVLASTIEQIGSLSPTITTKIHAKSSWGRHGLEVCSCAGYGDPGYATHWTLEIYNKNDYSVILKKGMIISQVSFEYLSSPCKKMYKSKYNNWGDNLLTDQERFKLMIPKPIKILED